MRIVENVAAIPPVTYRPATIAKVLTFFISNNIEIEIEHLI